MGASRYSTSMRQMSDHRQFYERLGQNLLAFREKLGLTQDSLAKRLGVTRASISNVELGKQRVLAHQLVELAHILKVPVEALLPQSQPVSPKALSSNVLAAQLSEVADSESVAAMMRKISSSIRVKKD